jgi:hypothetical protein
MNDIDMRTPPEICPVLSQALTKVYVAARRHTSIAYGGSRRATEARVPWWTLARDADGPAARDTTCQASLLGARILRCGLWEAARRKSSEEWCSGSRLDARIPLRE